MPSFLGLPDELLLLILSYLDPPALGRLGQACRRLYHVTGRDAVWRRLARECINTGFTLQGADIVPGIPVKERVKVSHNWKRGRCLRETPLNWKRNLMPWIQLDDDVLYLSQAEDIRSYRLRPDNNGLHRRPLSVFSGHREDVCRFVLANSHVVSGGGDGTIALHKIHSSISVQFSAHEQDVNCIDCLGGVIVSGSRDRTAKVWSLSSGRLGHCLHTIETEDRVWSIAISPLLSSFVTGTACCGHISPLRIWSLESGQLMTCLGTDFRRGAGVLDVSYETPYTLLSCGYDTFIRYWDIRTSTRKCVMEWEEPHDSALYCLQSDGNQMIASGSSYYGVVRLWDKRASRCLQVSQWCGPLECMEPGGIVKAFPKVKRLRDGTQKEELQKKRKVEGEIQDDWLKPVTAHIIQAGIGRARAEIFQKQIIQNGGRVCNPYSSEVTHVIVDEGMDCDRAFRIMKVNKIPPGAQLVKSAWLSLCLKERKMVDTAGYSVFISDRYLDVDDQAPKEHLISFRKNAPLKTCDETKGSTTENQAEVISPSQQNTEPQQQTAREEVSASRVSEDEVSDGENSGVTQGDLDALFLGRFSTTSTEDTSSTSTAPSVSAKWVCSQSSDSKKHSHNKPITDKLEVLAKAYTVQGDRWRALGYSKAINALKSFHKPVTSYQEACKIPGIGKKMAEKIEEILESGHLRKIDHIDESVGVMEIFSNIWGAGAKTAQMWYQQGFRSLDDIRAKATLTSQQAIGLKYYEDLLDRMPREEAAEIEQTVREVALSINPGLMSVACGSYRRGKLNCGDVDVLVTHPDGKSHKGVFGKLIDGLKARGFLTDDLVSQEDSGSQKKYMGVCCLPGLGRKHRRLDVIIVPYNEFACSLMYFTGSAHFNRSMRALAKTKGMSLSEHSLNKDVVRNGSLKVSTGFALPTTSEKDVFELLGLPYREPHERDW